MNEDTQRIAALETEIAELRAKFEKKELAAERYRTVFEDSLLGNQIISPDLKIVQVNQTLVELLGFRDKSELIDHEITEFTHPDHVRDWHRLQDKLWKQQVPSVSLETCLVHKSGNPIWVNVTSILFHDASGLLGYTIIEDISGRKAGLDKLRLSEQHLKTITDIMPQQVWTANGLGATSFVNRQLSEYTGLEAKEMLDKGWYGIVHPDDIGRCLEAWQTAVTTARPYFCEFRLLSKTGEYRWFLSRGIPVVEDGQVDLWLGTNTDIQSQKEKEQQKDEFLSIASHELKTPLTSIKLYNQLAIKTKDPQKQAELIKRVSTPIERLERLIADLLEVSKINAGKITYEPAEFDFSKLITETVANLQFTTESHQIDVEYNEPVQVYADKQRIEQVLNNLLLNAIKYSPKANRVVVRTQVIADTIIISVQDFGVGIREADLSRLFDRYYRVDNTAMRFEGLGLGLYISAEIIKRHNGSLWIESEPDQGSTFYFILPLNGKTLLREIDTDHKTYYVGNFITIKYNAEKGRLEADWLGYQNLESVKKGCMIMLDLLQKNNCHDVLNDNTEVLGNWSEASDWGAEYWFPAMAIAGLERFAWIHSPSAFSRLAADKSLNDAPGGLQARFFSDRESAEAWLDGRI